MVGLQVLFWVGHGLVMTAIPIETVRSEHRLKASMLAALPLEQVLSLAEVSRLSGVTAVRAELKMTQRGAAWIMTPVEGASVTLDAETGRPFAG